jgi:Uma2 family endonuclease
MNEHVRFTTVPELRDSDLPLTTNAAEGLMRRRWTVAEIDAMVKAGILLEDERFELIEGEAVPMPAKGNQHEVLKSQLNRHWGKLCPEHIEFIPETTFRISKDTFLEPDFVFVEGKDSVEGLKPETCLLAIELSDSTLGHDLGLKARLYAKFGIRELWVIDAVKREAHVHRRPLPEGYSEKILVPASGTLTPDFAPELAISLNAFRKART